MILITQRLTSSSSEVPIGASLTLPYELRKKGRLRSVLDDGRDVALMLERGITLQDGDLLGSECGIVIRASAAPEEVSTATTDDHLLLLRACYHLGNRHTQLQIEEHRLRYLRDHVLDAMLTQLGLDVEHETAPFIPESGAYHHE